MENFKQDLYITNSESNTETEFSKQIEECQSNLYRMEKLFFNLQKDSQRLLRKSQDSLTKSLDSSKLKLSHTCLDENAPLQEIYVKNHHSNNNTTLKEDTLANSEQNLITINNTSPLTFVVQVPSSIVDELKKDLHCSDFSNFLSKYSSKQNMKVLKKKRISTLFRNLFKKKKNNESNLNTLLLKNIKFIKLSSETNQNDTKDYERSYKSNTDKKLVTENNISIENTTNASVGLNNPNVNSQYGQTLVFPINLNSNTNIHEPKKSNLIVQHEITLKNDSSPYTHNIKIKNKPLTNSQSPSRIITEKVDSKRTELRKLSLNKLQSKHSLMKSFIDNLLKSTENLNDLEILKIFVEILHEEKLKKKTSCCMYCSNTKISHKESNFLYNFLQQLMVELQNKIKRVEKNISQTARKQSSKISICSSTAGISSEEDQYFENPAILKSKRMHKIIRRCQSPSMLKYRFCQSEKDIDKTENKNK